MRKSISKLLSVLVLSFATLTALCDTVDLPLIQLPDLDDNNDKTNIGHRIPQRPVNCSIDFDAKTVYTAPMVEDIESYEIWNEARTILLGSYADDSDFVEALSATTEPVAIVLTTSTTRYVGYYSM